MTSRPTGIFFAITLLCVGTMACGEHAIYVHICIYIYAQRAFEISVPVLAHANSECLYTHTIALV